MEPKYKSLGRVKAEESVTVKLISGNIESSNYSSWKPQMETLLNHHQLLGFIDGSVQHPPNRPTNDDAWKTDKVVKWWFECTISDPKLIAQVKACNTARQAWLSLENTFRESSRNASKEAGEDTLENRYFKFKIPMMKAALHDDWDEAQRILDSYPSAPHTCIDDKINVTPLQYAISTGKANHFVEKLLACMPDDDFVAFQDEKGWTALHFAAAVGNEGAAAILAQRIPRLCYIPNCFGDFPIQTAAFYGHRKTLRYLISVTRDDIHPNPYAGSCGLLLLLSAIEAEFFDIAIELVEKYPYLAAARLPNSNISALEKLIGRPVLSNRRRFNFWQCFVSSCMPEVTASIHDSKVISEEPGDIENMTYCGIHNRRVFRKLNDVVWKMLIKLVPHIRMIKEKSRANDEALQLVRLLCTKLKYGNSNDAIAIYNNAVLKATELGVGDVAETILDIYPNSAFAIRIPSMQNLFHRAVENRSQDVFNLIYQLSDYKHIFANYRDGKQNNLLHLSAKLGPSHKLDEISGAALQMQRELQWFKEVENSVLPNAREQRNKEGMTPKEVFTKEHETLKTNGEKWMKDTANSCTISAALISTVMFAAAITVPGGNQSDKGYPIFSSEPAFVIFAVSDAISLFTSITSLLLFLAILTSRYAEEDFLRVLPKRLIFGLATLFLSITSMMIAFGATLCLVSGQNRRRWVVYLMLIVTCLPATSFVRLQFPLLADLISTTYGPGIFGKKSNRLLF